VNLYWIITLWILQNCLQLIRTVISLYQAINLSTNVCQIKVNDLLESIIVEVRVAVAIGKMATDRLECADHASYSCHVDADVARTMKVLPTTFGINCICHVTQ